MEQVRLFTGFVASAAASRSSNDSGKGLTRAAVCSSNAKATAVLPHACAAQCLTLVGSYIVHICMCLKNTRYSSWMEQSYQLPTAHYLQHQSCSAVCRLNGACADTLGNRDGWLGLAALFSPFSRCCHDNRAHIDHTTFSYKSKNAAY